MRKMVQTIAFRLSMPIPFFLLLCMGIAWVTIPRILENSTIADATTSATNVVNQIKKIRGYYTKNVIVDVEASGDLSVGVAHENDPNVIPLPATFVHDISRLFSEQGISISLYSTFPFPGRANRQMDSFMQESWAYLNENPDGAYKRQEVKNGVTFLRVAVADRMVAEVCVSCHNSHPNSPKTDWKMGDVRGVLEVRQNIQGPLGVAHELTRNILFGVAVAGLALILIVWLTSRTITQPITEICENMDRLAAGDMDSEIPIAGRADELGQIGRTLVGLKDDLKRGRDAAVKQSEQMAVLLDALPDNYFHIDNQGTILNYHVHPGVGLINDPVAFAGRNIADILPPIPSALFKENMRKQQDTQDVVAWEYHLNFEGERRDREAHLCPITGSKEIVLVVRDLSKRRQAERQRALAEVRLEQIVASLPGAVVSRIISKTEGFQIIYVSPQSEDIWGYTPDEIYANQSLFDSVTHPDDVHEIQQHMFNAIENLKPFSHRFQITHRSGQSKWLETNTSAYRQEDGSTITVGIILDVTEEVKAEQQLEAQKEVAGRAQKLDSIGQLTGGVAHDFNNLLAAIMGCLELLRDDETDAENLSLIDAGLNATKRGAELTKNMLAFARRASLDPSVIDLNKLVDETRLWAGRTLPSNIDVKISLLDELWPIKADISSTESALLNLILNARDAMPEGGKLTIETTNAHIDESDLDPQQETMEPGRYVILAVSDTGHGIPSEKLEHIFEPFFSTKAPNEGTGLGLSTIMGFMQQSGGMVKVFSEIDVGTTFKLYFKASTEEVKPTVAQPPKTENLQGHHQQILVAEDDKNIRPILVAILEKAGYGVTVARSGDEALAIFEASPTIDLLLTDIMMPGNLQGVALSKAVRDKVADLPVVFMSGYANEEADKSNALRSEDIRLLKPIKRVDLLAAIKKSLGS